MSQLALFDSARGHLRSYRRAARELSLRCELAPRSDKARQAILKILHAKLDPFISRADDCACRYGHISGHASPVDVFYGHALVEGREGVAAQEWPEIQHGRTTTKDQQLLSTLLEQATLFMQSMRVLPTYSNSWEEELTKCERMYHNSISKPMAFLMDQPHNTHAMSDKKCSN